MLDPFSLFCLLLLQGGDLPVLVFFHNGMSGDVDQPRAIVDGSFLAAAGNIIVVTASYRVGVFGFFSTGKFMHFFLKIYIMLFLRKDQSGLQ